MYNHHPKLVTAWFVFRVAALCYILMCGVALGHALAQTLPVVTITSVTPDNDSVKVDFAAVTGAADYRIYNIADPSTVKYAGLNYPAAMGGHATVAPPMTEIQWNGLTPGVPVQLVVQAVNQLGPFPVGNVNNGSNGPENPDDTPCFVGSNMGMTGDGMMSTNGQGPPTDSPQVIAQSASFTVEATGQTPVPSETNASQVVYEPFTSGTFTQTSVDAANMEESWSLVTSANNWTIQAYNIDTTDTHPFIAENHFMDVMFDGGTPGTNNPLHVGHGALALSPSQTANFDSGQILHVTMEVDAHTTSRRWIGIDVAPASDPLDNFDEGVVDAASPSGSVNQSNTAVFFQFLQTNMDTDVYGKSATGALTDTAVTGAAGQALHYCQRVDGIGLDDRSRIDVFLSQTHYQIYENGVKEADYDFPTPLSFTDAKVYFVHYVYHTALALQEEEENMPYETFWINDVPYSDERHWQGLGFEVLPATTQWSTVPSLIGLFGTPASTTAGTGTTTGTGTGTTTTGTGTSTGTTTTGTGTTTTTATTASGTISKLTLETGGVELITVNGTSIQTTDTGLMGFAERCYFANASVAADFTAGSPNVLSSLTVGN